jgi:hypothetical protein
VCSVLTNPTIDEQLASLERSGDRAMIEKRLFEFAREADVTQRGALDNPAHAMKRMPEELAGARKIRIGRHRVYFTGSHLHCSYHAFYIKEFKKTGVNDEDDRRHQKRLIRASQEGPTRTIGVSDDQSSETSETLTDAESGSERRVELDVISVAAHRVCRIPVSEARLSRVQPPRRSRLPAASR